MLKRTRLKRVSPKQILKIQERKLITEKDWEIYLEIWKERPHRCIISGDWLGGEALTTYFHHLLKKETYPEYRHEKWNIVIVSPRVHDQVELNLDKVSPIKKLYLEALDRHYNFVKNQ